eukprot:4845427-Alexandrium_andersonii.AAC.1
MIDSENPGGVFAVWGDLPKPIITEGSLELYKIFSQRAMRDLFKDMSISPGRRLDDTEEHDVGRPTQDDRYRLAMRVLRRITGRQDCARRQGPGLGPARGR